MKERVLALTAIVLGAVILQFANGLLGILVPLQMGLMEKSTTVIGVVVSAYSLGFLLGCRSAPDFIRPIGHIRAFAALAAILSVTTLLFTASESPVMWALLRFATGLCLSGLQAVIESWIAGEASKTDRGRVIAVYMLCNKTALMGGQGLLVLGDVTSASFFILVCGCFSLSLVPVALTRAAAPVHQEKTTLGFRALYRIAPIGVVGCVGAGLVNSAVLGLAPVYGLHVGLAASQIPLLAVAAQLGSLIVQWPLGWLSDRIDRRYVIAFATLTSAAASLAAALLGGQGATLVVFLFGLWGAFSLSVYSICIAHASDYAEPSQLVRVISSLLMAWAIGSTVGPPLATATMTAVGTDGLLFYAAAIAGVVGVFSIWRMSQRSPIPVDEREAFVNLPATSPAVAELMSNAPSTVQDERRGVTDMPAARPVGD